MASYTPQELRTVLTDAGLSQSAAARALEIDPRTMRRYIAGELPVPTVVALALNEVIRHRTLSARLLFGHGRRAAVETIKARHYTRSVPSGKSHYIEYGPAYVVWSIPANINAAKSVLGWDGIVWELTRLWAPDGHARNLLTQAISAATDVIRALENPDALVSYADPNAGHHGGVYRAASWIHHGSSTETRAWRGPDGKMVPRRRFHSDSRFLRKPQIEALGYVQVKVQGKERFVKPLSRKARKVLKCTPEQQAGPGAEKCPGCGLMSIHQYTGEPICGCPV